MEIKNKKGLCIIISSPSGGGKTTLKNKIIEKFPEIKYSISYTTRDSRENEVNNKDYNFVTQEQFNEMLENNKFIEYAKVHSYMYGTGVEVLDYINQGFDVILDIDIQGAESIRKKIPDAVSIFTLPPCWSVLEQRLYNRETDSKEVIENRLKQAKLEIQEYKKYDYILINDNIEEAVCEFENIIQVEKLKIKRVEVDLNDFYSR
jgi:guanylate kinase